MSDEEQNMNAVLAVPPKLANGIRGYLGTCPYDEVKALIEEYEKCGYVRVNPMEQPQGDGEPSTPDAPDKGDPKAPDAGAPLKQVKPGATG